jgi:hypothetical protein
MHIQKRLSQVGDRLSQIREDLRIVEEQLLFQMDVLEEAKTRMLVSENPVADREFRIARGSSASARASLRRSRISSRSRTGFWISC